MAVRITKALDSETTVLHVAGRLTLESAGLLAEEFQTVDGPVALDLSGLRSADPDGVAIILKIASSGAALLGASPYIELLLEREF